MFYDAGGVQTSGVGAIQVERSLLSRFGRTSPLPRTLAARLQAEPSLKYNHINPYARRLLETAVAQPALGAATPAAASTAAASTAAASTAGATTPAATTGEKCMTEESTDFQGGDLRVGREVTCRSDGVAAVARAASM